MQVVTCRALASSLVMSLVLMSGALVGPAGSGGGHVDGAPRMRQGLPKSWFEETECGVGLVSTLKTSSF